MTTASQMVFEENTIKRQSTANSLNLISFKWINFLLRMFFHVLQKFIQFPYINLSYFPAFLTFFNRGIKRKLFSMSLWTRCWIPLVDERISRFKHLFSNWKLIFFDQRTLQRKIRLNYQLIVRASRKVGVQIDKGKMEATRPDFSLFVLIVTSFVQQSEAANCPKTRHRTPPKCMAFSVYCSSCNYVLRKLAIIRSPCQTIPSWQPLKSDRFSRNFFHFRFNISVYNHPSIHPLTTGFCKIHFHEYSAINFKLESSAQAPTDADVSFILGICLMKNSGRAGAYGADVKALIEVEAFRVYLVLMDERV